jgi:hypothetical protein
VFYMDVVKVYRDVAMIYTRMLQASVPNVSSVFPNVCYKCIYLNIVYVSHVYYKRRVFASFHIHVSSVLSVFFFYVAIIASRCFKSRSGIAHEMHVGTERGASVAHAGTQRRRCPGGTGPHVGARNAGTSGAMSKRRGPSRGHEKQSRNCSR